MIMPWTSEHLQWLVDTGETCTTVDGRTVEIWEFRHTPDDDILSAWAKHFRNHYCRDTEIDDLIAGTTFATSPSPRSEYLLNIKFPDSTAPPGPSTRSGDFGEILIADYVEYVLGYWVPRTRFCDRVNRNDPTKGVDVIGLRVLEDGKTSPQDSLLLFESKCTLSDNPPSGTNRLQNAVDDSCKDYRVRKAESLNAIKQWFKIRGQKDLAMRIQRFQNDEDRPYLELSGAAALLSPSAYDTDVLRTTDTSAHPNKNQLILLVIRGDAMMTLVNELYRRSADEA